MEAERKVKRENGTSHPVGVNRKLFLIAIFILSLALVAMGVELLPVGSAHKDVEQTLSVEIVEKLELSFPKERNYKKNGKLHIWIPLPSSDNYQRVEALHINSPWAYKIIRDPDFNNDILFIEKNSSSAEFDFETSVDINWQYLIRRKEQHGFSNAVNIVQRQNSNEFYLHERGLVIIDNRIREISKSVTSGLSDPLKKAKAIYNYVLAHVDYDTSIPGWGKGDVTYACDVGKGNCTDFHSLFISLSRAAGIPARFRIGYPLPAEPQGKLLKPYHCWAEFFIEGKGYAPVDISEAWKNPDKADYYFGNLDKDRVLISTGRNINLLPGDDKVPLANYFVKPYIELDGREYNNFEIERSYTKLN